ncbi:hypothetical protein M2093_000057 [Breznakia sp. PH1-1]|nr:hypothetical protein [Breznakia sp. PH1-1]MDH6403153.1 hypothetical protein [Breznakia sp. PF1-11]MDH6410862.1 hypothetical protein [Breznakia sp. PFB1-11]MDH6413081.1 hypothetical protein [Breznakia sp. PFB1-14]MDH6415449.1 hypothetical protein [Breznakia sp. PFB1-4]MDH6417748.1 hypothetical protein [Breznakia sp. PFB1-12]MDH6473033.1 hypothetical protein [Breznakia sp. PFB2-30]MDH6475189.1 hypothetical protein [Breznakia sp. PFB1-19]
MDGHGALFHTYLLRYASMNALDQDKKKGQFAWKTVYPYLGAVCTLCSGLLLAYSFHENFQSSIINLLYYFTFYGNVFYMAHFYSGYIRNRSLQYKKYTEWILLSRILVHFMIHAMHQVRFMLTSSQMLQLLVGITLIHTLVVYRVDDLLCKSIVNENEQ